MSSQVRGTLSLLFYFNLIYGIMQVSTYDPLEELLETRREDRAHHRWRAGVPQQRDGRRASLFGNREAVGGWSCRSPSSGGVTSNIVWLDSEGPLRSQAPGRR